MLWLRLKTLLILLFHSEGKDYIIAMMLGFLRENSSGRSLIYIIQSIVLILNKLVLLTIFTYLILDLAGKESVALAQ